MGGVINLCLRSIVPCRKCSKKKAKLRKIEQCNHPTLEVLNSLQKVLKKEGGDKIESCNHPTAEVLNSMQKLLKQKAKMR